MTKDELVKTGAHYFDNESVKVMYVSSDGHWFHEGAKRAAYNHIGGKNLDVFEITRADAFGKKKAEKVEPQEEVSIEPVEVPTESKDETPSESTEETPKPKTKPKKGNRRG